MSDDLGSEITSDTTASEFHQENTHPTTDHSQEELVVFTSGNSDADDDENQCKDVTEENDTHWTINSSVTRECISLEEVQLTSRAKDEEETDELSFPPAESSVELKKADVVLAAPLEVANGNVSIHTKSNFSETLHQIATGGDEKIVHLDSTNKVTTAEVDEEILLFKKEKHIDDQDETKFVETVKQDKETSNDLKFANNFNSLWQNASLTSFRRWESDPAIESETEGTLEEEHKFPVVYRLSLRFSKVFPRKVEKIHLDSSFEKAGFLQKLSGRGFPYLNQWKRRYCVLTKGRLYLYEKETNKSSDKCTSVIDLKYFDHVTEAMQKDSKKVSNVFVVTSQDRSFFDPGRHLFAADTLTEMHDWIAKLRESIELIRNNNRPTKGSNTQQNKRNSQGLPTEDQQQQKQNLGVSVQHQRTDVTVASVDVVDARVPETLEEFRTKQEFASSLKKKLKIESSDAKGDEEISEKETLEDDNDKETVSPTTIPPGKKISSTTISLQNPNLTLEAKPQLESITKNRIRGPQGRRAPQLRRTIIMKERASSMSALQQEGLTDNDARSGTPHGIRASTLTADGVLLAGTPSPNFSKSSGMNLANNDMNASFDDIESALFFRRPSPLREEPSETIQRPQDKKKKSTFSFRNFRISKTPSERNTKEKTFSIFRSNTFKFRAFRSNTAAANEHPDSSTSKNKICSIL